MFETINPTNKYTDKNTIPEINLNHAISTNIDPLSKSKMNIDEFSIKSHKMNID